MKLVKKPLFPLSVLSVALMSSYVQAADDAAAADASAQTLQNVVVKGVQSTRRVTLKNLGETTATQLKEVLVNEPSISMGAGAGTSQFIYLRGMGHNSIDVKVDNAYTDSQIHYHQGRHMLDPALVKIIGVQKGAGSASAGIGQTNGAIIAKTVDAADLLKNSTNPNFGVRLNAGYNSNDGHNYGAAVFGKVGAFDYLLLGNRVQENNYKGGRGYWDATSNTSRVTLSELSKTSYLAKLGATFGNHRFVLSHMHEQHKGDRAVREEFGNFGGQNPAGRKMYVDKTDLTWTATDLGFAESAEANVYRLVHGRWSANDSGNNYAGGRRNGTGSTKNTVETIGANVNFDTRINERVLLKYGVNYRNQTVKPNRIFRAGISEQEKQDVGFYVEGITDVTDKLTLTTGLRYDHFNFKAMDGRKRSDGAINPSISAIYQVTPELSFNALHNYATRSPRMHDALMSHGNSIVSIAPHTKAEQARNTEIGFAYRTETYGVEGSYFWQSIKDALGTGNGRDNHTPGANTAIINAGKIKNHGYELSGYYRYENLTARLGVAHSKPRFYGSNLSNNPEYAMPIGRTWTASLAYRFANPNLELGVQYRAVEQVKPEDDFFVVNDNGTPKLGRSGGLGKSGYGVVDVSANWKPFNNDQMNVNFAVDNVGNKKYVPHGQRGPASFVGAGRQFRVGVNYTF